jgi:erythromycin esterase-like protein
MMMVRDSKNSGRCVGRLLKLVVLYGLLDGPAQAWAQPTGTLTIEAQVAEAVCEKKIVVLGELPSHGEARGFQAKARIVERLVNRCGFDAVLFEAPIYDFLGLQEALAEDRAVPAQLNRAIGGFWVTRGLSAWRRWLFDQAIDGQLLLGGLDDQVSATSDFARATLPGLVARSVPAQSASECQQAVARNLSWRYSAEQQFDEAERIRLQRCARVAADALARGTEHGVGAIEQVMIENLASLYDRQFSLAARDRDEVMYRNLRWHNDRMPAESKFVVWTATVHAARQQGERENKPLGTWLSEEWGDRLAVFGFSAFSGQSSRAGSPSQPLPAAPPGSLEALTTIADTAWVYLNTSALREIGVVPSRLFGKFTSADWSVLFDGVLVIREEIAPVFEQR